MKKIIYVFTAALLCIILSSCGKNAKVIEIESKIDNIGEITIDSSTDFELIDSLISALSPEEIDSIKNYNTYLNLKQEYNNCLEDYAASILKQINSADNMSLEDALSIIDNANVDYNSLNEKRNEIQTLMSCSGMFYQDGDYPTSVCFTIKNGEYWMSIDYPNYAGTIDDSQVLPLIDGEYLFVSNPIGTHIDFLFHLEHQVNFIIKLGADSLNIVWDGIDYTLKRQ